MKTTMKKKEYFQPAIRVITLKPTSILAGSTGRLEKGEKDDPDVPGCDGDGYVWAESKRQGVFGDVW